MKGTKCLSRLEKRNEWMKRKSLAVLKEMATLIVVWYMLYHIARISSLRTPEVTVSYLAGNIGTKRGMVVAKVPRWYAKLSCFRAWRDVRH